MTGRRRDFRRRCVGGIVSTWFGLIAAIQMQAMEPAPAGVVEAGAPAFVVLGPEALGLSTAPVDFKILPDHRILVVSQRELAFGDGVRWETFRAGDGEPPILSSVAVDADGEIYTGIDGAIARLQLLSGARWRLEPVVKLPEEAATQNQPLISVEALPQQWFWYGGNGAIVAWRPGEQPRTTGHMSGIERVFTLDGDAFISDESSGGLHRMKQSGGLELVSAGGVWVSEVVTSATPYSPGLLLVGTGSSGLKLFDGKSFIPFGRPGLIARGNRITDICPIGDRFFAASIDSFGIVFFDRDGHMVQVLDRSLDHRLARVRRLLYSDTGVVWGLLNDGVVRVQFPSPISNFEPLLPSGLRYAEPMRHNGSLWVLADGRALRADYDDFGRLEKFEDETPPGSYLFTLMVVDGGLFASNDAGIYLHEDAGWRLILPGVLNARVGVAPSTRDRIFYVARGEFGVIRRAGHGFEAERISKPELGDSYAAKVDAQGIGWIELGTSLVGRFDASGDRPTLETFGAADGLSTLGWIEIYVFDGVARFHVSNRLYRYRDTPGSFVEDRELVARYPQLAQATGRPVTDRAGRLWYSLNGVMKVVDRTAPGGNEPVDITPVGFSPTSYTPQDDGVIWIFERGRFARFDPRMPSMPEAPLEVQISRVQFSSSSRTVNAPGASLGEIDFSDNSLVFTFAAPANPFSSPVSFEVRLEGAGNGWVSTGTSGSAVFNRLKEDKYVFHVRPVRAGVPGTEASVAFTILPPWYRTTAAWVAYVCIALSFLGFVMWLSSFLQRRENDRLELLVAQRTAELSNSNNQLNNQIEETTRKSTALSASEERYRELNTGLENRVHERTAELEEVHRQLVAASRKAGMAEVATGVLHNVGNVLNSVNVSATVVRDTLRGSEVASLERVAALIRERNGDFGTFIANDPKGRHLPRFIVQLSEQIAREHSVISAENDHLVRNVEHIKGIVAMQQGYGTVSGVLEEVSLQALVHDAIGMHTNSFSRHAIKVAKHFDDLPPVLADKHKILQILVNLFQNAKQAIHDTGRENGLIEARVSLGDDGDARISISDDGVGIPAENLVRIFSHGFTTRTNGHGFGLHSGALAAREMGGALKAESPGPGLGSTFTLQFPLKVAKSASTK